MFKVEVTCKNDAASHSINKLLEQLPKIVAEELNNLHGTELECGKGRPEGTSLRVWQCGRYERLCLDADVEIVIMAKDFPGRSLMIDARAQEICKRAKSLLPSSTKVYVAIWTGQAAFAQSYENPT
ncbi:MAG: hypothetical protein WAP74_04230 [Patescibacteria group bacterium]